MKKETGFTLIELMIAVTITAVVLSGVYMAYVSQQRNYVMNDQVATMQQTVRSTQLLLEKDIREAGTYDPRQGLPPAVCGANPPGFCKANFDEMQLTNDADFSNVIGDVPDENITYSFTPDNPPFQKGVLQRTITMAGGGALAPETIAENVSAVNFIYFSGTTPLNTATTNVGAATLDQITNVQINLVVRADRPEPNYVNRITYRNQLGQVIIPAPPMDNYRRKLLTISVQCRNLTY